MKRPAREAARQDLPIRQYILNALEERLSQNLGTDVDELLGVTAIADPVLARLWDSSRDARYDEL